MIVKIKSSRRFDYSSTGMSQQQSSSTHAAGLPSYHQVIMQMAVALVSSCLLKILFDTYKAVLTAIVRNPHFHKLQVYHFNLVSIPFSLFYSVSHHTPMCLACDYDGTTGSCVQLISLTEFNRCVVTGTCTTSMAVVISIR